MKRLDKVLTRLQENGLRVKGKKCSFLKKEVTYLGHVVSRDGIAVIEEKIREWPTPKNGREVSSFLGLAFYYRRFISKFACIAGSLHKVSAKKKQTKESSFEWSDEQETSFKALKESLMRAPVLAYPCFNKDFTLEIDASGKGLGACLSQKDDDRRLHPVAYASMTL